jgi:hypothetical protein
MPVYCSSARVAAPHDGNRQRERVRMILSKIIGLI